MQVIVCSYEAIVRNSLSIMIDTSPRPGGLTETSDHTDTLSSVYQKRKYEQHLPTALTCAASPRVHRGLSHGSDGQSEVNCILTWKEEPARKKSEESKNPHPPPKDKLPHYPWFQPGSRKKRCVWGSCTCILLHLAGVDARRDLMSRCAAGPMGGAALAHRGFFFF